jgi:Asp-tRNA(Asn)/Glu-tRNA(Gln) amidotransferase A subunit family amidase
MITVSGGRGRVLRTREEVRKQRVEHLRHTVYVELHSDRRGALGLKLGHLSREVDFETLLPRLRNFVAFSPLNNATGSPAMSLPLGSTSDGLPIGVHFAGRHGGERTLLELAYELEHSRPFPRIQNATQTNA